MKVTRSPQGSWLLELSSDEATDLRHLIETSRDCASLMLDFNNAGSCFSDRGGDALMRLLGCEQLRLESLGEKFEKVSDALCLAKAAPIAVDTIAPKKAAVRQ